MDELTDIILSEIREIGLGKVHITQVIDDNLVGLREIERQNYVATT